MRHRLSDPAPTLHGMTGNRLREIYGRATGPWRDVLACLRRHACELTLAQVGLLDAQNEAGALPCLIETRGLFRRVRVHRGMGAVIID